ncbi:MAG: hypothetical protein ABSH22_10785 [Tepidisphaeraceae bacterium]|jgi:hypothetical protein
MLHNDQVEELITLVFSLDREALVDQFVQYPARFPIDFTPQFLQQTPLERLQHIFIALCLQTQQMPSLAASVA